MRVGYRFERAGVRGSRGAKWVGMWMRWIVESRMRGAVGIGRDNGKKFDLPLALPRHLSQYH